MSPKVSIIVPNYNHSKFLRMRIESILNQTFQNFELILLDDFSTDNSQEILLNYKNHPKVSHCSFNNINSGSTFKQWNKGVSLACGEYIWIAESDDYSDPRFLEKSVNKMLESNADICFTKSIFVDENDKILESIYDKTEILLSDFVHDGNFLIRNYFAFFNLIPNASSVVFKKNELNFDLFSELQQFTINGDWFLWVNLIFNKKCAYISESLNYFRRHQNASSSLNVDNFNNIKEALKINIWLKKNGIYVTNNIWIKCWINQADYNLLTILRMNFWQIYRLSKKIHQFPICYIIYQIYKNKSSKCIKLL